MDQDRSYRLSRREALRLSAATLLAAGLAGGIGHSALAALPEGFPGETSVVYDVVRDGAVVGKYRFDFSEEDGDLLVRSDVSIDVSLLIIPVYSLRHEGLERWRNGKMVTFHSETDDNGTKRVVDIVPEGGEYRVTHNGDVDMRPGEAMLGTLWHPDTPNAPMLIDPIKGKLRDVTITDQGSMTISVPFGTAEAKHYAIRGEIAQDIWYGPDFYLWQAEFPVKMGGVLTLRRRK
ncbi:MAG: DUF6134 family protein [Rhodospirillaceae bacterium]|nr:DUF6134 family protein [Rhodospirillaceae bacterium]